MRVGDDEEDDEERLVDELTPTLHEEREGDVSATMEAIVC